MKILQSWMMIAKYRDLMMERSGKARIDLDEGGLVLVVMDRMYVMKLIDSCSL